jgi:hypothetical protein
MYSFRFLPRSKMRWKFAARWPIPADMTTGTGRFNLVQGFIGTVIAIAAAISTGTTGFLFEKFGHLPGFLVLGAVAAAATLLFWAALTETKPGKYLD